MGNNRAFTTLSYDGKMVTDWTNGGTYSSLGDGVNCITEPNCELVSYYIFLFINLLVNIHAYGSAREE